MTADDEQQGGGEQYDAPNQQVVRPDASGPADEGTGGSGGESADSRSGESGTRRSGESGTRRSADDAARTEATDDLDEMTKAQLHSYAVQHDVHVTADMTKDDIRQAIEDAR